MSTKGKKSNESPRWTFDEFRRTGKSHLASAIRLPRSEPASGIHSQSSAYLAQLALECTLKAQLLYRAGCASATDLARQLPSLHKEYFKGTKGHDIALLAKHLHLEKTMKLQGKAWADDSTWERLTSAARPYSLRYGSEEPTPAEVEDDISRVQSIVHAVSSAMPRKPLAGDQRPPASKK